MIREVLRECLIFICIAFAPVLAYIIFCLGRGFSERR